MAPETPPGDASRGAPSTPPSDRRESTRAPIELKVEYRRLNSFFADYTRNISRGGTFIATDRPLPLGTAFVFKLMVPTLEQGMELRGTVAWTVAAEAATATQPAGMGIRFRYESEVERAAVHGVVERLMVQSLGPALYREILAESAANPAGQGAGGIKSG